MTISPVIWVSVLLSIRLLVFCVLVFRHFSKKYSFTSVYLFLVSQITVKTVKVSNLSLGASERDVHEFFSFSGDIEYVEMRRFL